jgi:hypothetical protein
MSADTDRKPVLLRFFDSFLQERNIKWLLAIGMLILLASSVMLVTAHWDKAGYTPVWKYLTLVGYAAAIFAASQWAYFRACLRKTGTGLMALTVLLAPLTFLALRWVQTDDFPLGTSLALLTLNFAVVLFAVRRIFTHFLRGPQPTFTISFLGLCLAGAILPEIQWATLHPLAAPLAALVLWTMFAAGTVKVNRHVFWLTESQQSPRIFGFFPLLLLGSQFLLLFAMSFAGHIELQWIGLGCVLTAFPILLVTDQIVGIFQQRTGNLVRPLPWSISLPFGAGLLLTVVGVCLAGLGLRPPHVVPLALVPTAALAAVVMGLVARRTGHRAFVWAMLILVTLAYNFSYVFFRETARTVLAQGAAAVRESRLPLAFYGLTYLPLLLGLTVAARFAASRGREVFAQPIRTFCITLPGLLLMLACTYTTAMFPVSAALLALSVAQVFIFRDRRLVYLAIAAWFVGSLGVIPFAQFFLEMAFPANAQLMVLVLASAALLMPGLILDRFVQTLPNSWNEKRKLERMIYDSPCEFFSVGSSFVLGILGLVWLSEFNPTPTFWAATLLLIGLQFVHSLRRVELPLGPIVYGFATFYGVYFVEELPGVSPSAIASVSVLFLLMQWVATYFLANRPQLRVSHVYLPTLKVASLAGLSAGMYALCLWPMLCEVLQLPAGLMFDSNWMIRLLLIVWTFDAARRYAQPFFTVLGTVAVFFAASSLLVLNLGNAAYEWMPLAWSTIAFSGILAVKLWQDWRLNQLNAITANRFSDELKTFIRPLNLMLPALQMILAIATLPLMSWPLRLAAVVAVVSLIVIARFRRDQQLGYAGLLVFNWHGLVALAACLYPSAEYLPSLFQSEAFFVVLPLTFASSISLSVWQGLRLRVSKTAAEVCDLQRIFLYLVIAAGLVVSLLAPTLDLQNGFFAAATFTLLALSVTVEACQRKSESFVWAAEAIVMAAVGYLAYFDWLVFGHGWAMFVVLGLGVGAYVLSQIACRFPQTNILTRPLAQTGFWLPLLTVAIGVGRHFFYANPQWMGMNSLAILLVAAFYFYHAIERRENWLWMLSAGIVNLAMLMLWRELKLTDPQFYMIPIGVSLLGLVQLLRKEIPAKFHDPLRYCGALIILVSPTFHILGGSWIHMVTLLVASVLIVLVSIGLRIRALMYTGTAFLLADLVAMIVQGSLAHPNLLWLVGLGVGAAVVAFGAFCENHREQLEQRLRMISATLKQWN